MEPEQILAWIDERKAALGIKSDRKIENEAGHPEAIRNFRRGRSIPKHATLKALARVLGEPPAGLFDPPTPSHNGQVPTLQDLEDELVRLESEADHVRIAISVLKSRKRAV